MKDTPGGREQEQVLGMLLWGKSPKEIGKHRNPKIGLIESENQIPGGSGAPTVHPQHAYTLTNTRTHSLTVVACVLHSLTH